MLSFYTIDPNLNEKISFRRFYRKVSTVNFDQEETRDSLTETRRESFGNKNAGHGTDPTHATASWIGRMIPRLIVSMLESFRFRAFLEVISRSFS